MEKGSSSSSASGGGGDAADSVFNGLNFGKKIYFEGVGSGLRPRLPEEEKAAEHPRSPAKKGRTAAAVQGGQPPRCQVEGCNVDLSGTKAYYCRHKVCGTHSKSSQVIVAGLHQRFCQQCSRFHQLAEFDQGKRSCRRRLAGHNERRRKPPPLLSSSFYTTSQLSPHTFDNCSKSGAIVMDFSGRRNSWPNNNTITTTKHEQEEDDDGDDLLEGSTTMHSCRGPVISSEGSSSTSALSLLSNQPTLAPVSQFSWGFKRNNHHHRDQQQGNNISSTDFHEMAPRMPSLAEHFTQYSGDDEPSRRFHQPSEGRYNGLDGSRSAYDSSDQHINWSL